MHFIDEAKIYLKAGDGGNGCRSFRREKYIDMGGPDGGDGGRGGGIIIKSDAHLNTLVNFRYKQHFKAEAGQSGKGANRSGKSGEDMILSVPVGTQIYCDDLLIFDFTKDEQEFCFIKGGRGGLGNSHFKSSVTQAPTRKTEGEEGAEQWIWLKLKLLSDVGVIGLPNAGKSTLLSVISAAKPKIADYPFTTLSPNLGVVYLNEEEFVVADIPGLIEGASSGAGLGDKFLKHIERCKILIHLIDATSDDVLADYTTVKKELHAYSKILEQKLEIICLNKVEMLTQEELNAKRLELSKIGADIYEISSFTKNGIDVLLNKTLTALKNYDPEVSL